MALKKAISLFWIVLCLSGLVGCRLSKPYFENFKEYEEDFVSVKNFIIDYSTSLNNPTQLIIDISDCYLTVDGHIISDKNLEKSIKRLSENDFSYIEKCSDYIIFWDDETGYYGVMWSENPKQSINRIIENSRPNMKSKKLTDNWYEIGALYSI